MNENPYVQRYRKIQTSVDGLTLQWAFIVEKREES